MESNHSNSRPAAIGEWLLVVLIVGLLAAIGILAADGGGTLTAMLAVTSTPTASPTVLYTLTPSHTPSDTPTPTKTLTPSATPTDTPTPRSPLPGVAATVTPLPTLEVYTTTITPVPTPAPLVELPRDTINIVALGSDKRPNDSAWRTDTVILISVHKDPTYVTLLTIPRDLWVYIPNYQYNRFNVADAHGERKQYPGGGAGLVKQTIQYNLGIEIQYFIRVDFNAFRAIIDTLGVIRPGDDKPTIRVLAECALTDVFPDVPEDQTDIIAADQISTTITGTLEIIPGYNYLDSKHALWYARSRLTTNDFDRSRRILGLGLALLQAAQENGTLGKVPELWGEFITSVQTDLTLNDALWLAGVASEIDPLKIKLRQIDNVVTQGFVAGNGAEVLAWNPEILALVLEEAFAPPPENLTSQASAKVEVYNASGRPDWDDLAVDRLLRYNFGVALPSNPDADFRADSAIIDYTTTPKGSRLALLARLFDVPAGNIVAQPNPNSLVDYRLLVGANYNSCRKPPPPVEVTKTPTPTSAPTLPPAP